MGGDAKYIRSTNLVDNRKHRNNIETLMSRWHADPDLIREPIPSPSTYVFIPYAIGATGAGYHTVQKLDFHVRPPRVYLVDQEGKLTHASIAALIGYGVICKPSHMKPKAIETLAGAQPDVHQGQKLAKLHHLEDNKLVTRDILTGLADGFDAALARQMSRE